MNGTQLNKLKKRGAYYSYRPKECYRFSDGIEDYTQFFIFYENGYFLGYGVPGFVAPNELEGSIKRLLNSGLRGDYRQSISLWGPYIIRGDSVFLQQLGTEETLISAHKKKAKIMNDGSIEFSEGFCRENPSQTKIFKFQGMKSKPDSTNSFMTNKTLIRAIEAEKKRRRIP